MTTAQSAFIDRWKTLLRVQDWDITWKEIKRFRDPETTGGTVTHIPTKAARITVKKGLPTREFEYTIIHELLHVVFPIVSQLSVRNVMLAVEVEQGIESLARLLWVLDRERMLWSACGADGGARRTRKPATTRTTAARRVGR